MLVALLAVTGPLPTVVAPYPPTREVDPHVKCIQWNVSNIHPPKSSQTP